MTSCEQRFITKEHIATYTNSLVYSSFMGSLEAIICTNTEVKLMLLKQAQPTCKCVLTCGLLYINSILWAYVLPC